MPMEEEPSPHPEIVVFQQTTPSGSPYPNVLQRRDGSSTVAHEVAASMAAAHAQQNIIPSHVRHTDLLESEREMQRIMAEQREAVAAAAAKRKRQAVEVVCESGIPLAQPAQPAARIDMFQAACDGDAGRLRENLDAGADINAVGQPNPNTYAGLQFEKRWTFFGTPLIFAAAFGRERAVDALLSWGADIWVPSSTGLTAKDYAVHRKYEAIVAAIEAAEEHQPAPRRTSEAPAP